ncbi:MAG: CopG family transcriptional regulator [Ignavibacteria bacterium]|nr:CopG family transcriptional regulator [Ignavibacteria bacterium]
MSKTITLKLDDESYRILSAMAQSDNRPLSNFIENAAIKYIERANLADEFEMLEIKNNTDLNKSLKRGVADAKAKNGRFV